MPDSRDAELCKRCGAENPSWSAPSPLWNAVMRGGSINGNSIFSDMVCMTCFTVLAEEKGIAQGWRLEAQTVHVELETMTPSGRFWDDDSRMWVETDPADPELARLNDQIAAAEQAYDQALDDPVCEGLDRAGAVLARLYARKRELTTVKEPA